MAILQGGGAVKETMMGRFFGVVARPPTWLNVLFNVLAFPLGLFYFVFLATGLSLGIGLVVIWVGIPILLLVAGAWWLFGAFERVQARYLLGATVPDPPRHWERVDGVWAKLKAHFGSASTWNDLVYLFAKLPFGIASTTLLVIAASFTGFFLSMPFFTVFRVPVDTGGVWGSGVPPWWVSLPALFIGLVVLLISLHVINGWSWVCARWAEVMLGGGQGSRATVWQAAAPVIAAPADAAPIVVAPTVTASTAAAPAVTAPPAAPDSEDSTRSDTTDP